jgi:hypothetical protein
MFYHVFLTDFDFGTMSLERGSSNADRSFSKVIKAASGMNISKCGSILLVISFSSEGLG